MKRSMHTTDRAVHSSLRSLLKLFGGAWLAWMLLCCVLSGAMISGIGYAIYWGLSLAERAVEVQESGRGSVESQPEAPASRP